MAMKLITKTPTKGKLIPSSLIIDLLDSRVTHLQSLNKASQEIAKICHSFLNVNLLSLFLYDGYRDTLILVGCNESDNAEVPQKKINEFPIGLIEACFSRKKSIYIDRRFKNIKKYSKELYCLENFIKEEVVSGAIIPFSTEFECEGVILAINKFAGNNNAKYEEFQKEDKKTLELIACIIGNIIQIAWVNYQGVLILELGNKLAGGEVLKRLESIVDVALKLTNSRSACFYYSDDKKSETLKLIYGCGVSKETQNAASELNVDNSVCGKVAKTQKYKIVKNIEYEEKAANKEYMRKEKLHSAVIVPVLSSKGMGSLGVFAPRDRDYQPTTIENLLHLSNIMSQTLEMPLVTKMIDQVAHLGHTLRGPLTKLLRYNKDMAEICDGCKNACGKSGIIVINKNFRKEATTFSNRIDSMLYIREGALEAAGLNFTLNGIQSILGDCVDRFYDKAQERNIKLIVYDSAKNLPPIYCDKVMVEIVFDNIIENAIKYSWRNENIVIKGIVEEKHLVVSFSDKGLGIPKDMWGDIFLGTMRSPFKDNTRYIKGTGFGLEVVKNIMALHNGRVYVESYPFLNDQNRIKQFDGFTTTFFIKFIKKETL